MLKSAGFAEPKIREEILNFLRHLAARDAEVAVYHFGEEYAAEAIKARLSGASAKSDSMKGQKRKAV